MTMILPVPNGHPSGEPAETERMQVMVHVQAEVLGPKHARRCANVWLTMNAGHLLMVENPELVLGEPLQWRFDVILSVPQHEQPGAVSQTRIGQIRLDAVSGEVVDPTTVVEELKRNASALATH